jgi:hypothetical protein
MKSFVQVRARALIRRLLLLELIASQGPLRLRTRHQTVTKETCFYIMAAMLAAQPTHISVRSYSSCPGLSDRQSTRLL